MIEATFDNVIVRCVYKQEESVIIIPDKFEKSQFGFHGEVLAIGPDYPNNELKVGDKAVFPRNEGIKMDVDGEELLMLRERWIMGVLDE